MLTEVNKVALAKDFVVDSLVAGVVEHRKVVETTQTSDQLVALDLDFPSVGDLLNSLSVFLTNAALYQSQQNMEFRVVPPEDKNPISFVNPPEILKWQMWRIARWKPIIDAILEDNDYQYATDILVLGIIAQETQGDPDAICNAFDTERGNCAVGVMGITIGHCGLSESQLKNTRLNIECGTRIINLVYEQALEHGFRPGREATAAALAAFNCGWQSLLADKCFSFGGWMYSWKVLNYWVPLLENYLEEQHGL